MGTILMRHVVTTTLILSIIAPTLLGMPYAASQKVYEISHYYAIYEVWNDSSLNVTESITFSFITGDFSWAERTIPHRGFDALEQPNIRLADGTQLQFEESYSWSGEYYFKWYYGPVYSPVELTFVLSYRLTNALTQPSTLQNGFDWSAVGSDWRVAVRNLQVDVILPSVYDDPSLFNWSPYQDATHYILGTRSVVQFNYPYLPPRTPYRAIIYFPKVGDIQVSPQRFLRESPFTMGLLIFSILSLSLIPVWWVKGREPKVPLPSSSSVGISLPSGRSPAEVGYIITQRYGTKEMISTILDLAKKGFVQIIHEPSKQLSRFARGGEEVRFEIREKGKDENERATLKLHELLTLEMLEDAGSSRHIATARPNASEISGQLARSLTDEELFAANPRRTRTRYAIIGVAIFASMLCATIILGLRAPQIATIYGSILLGVGFFGFPLIVVGYFMPKLTRRGAEEKSTWRQFLENVRNNVEGLAKQDPNQAVQLFDDLVPWFFLIPSLKSLRRQQAWFKNLGSDLRHVHYVPAWYVYNGAPSTAPGGTISVIGDFGAFMANFSTAFNTMSTSAATATGGGAGAGGGGGGGGGGAG